MYRIATSARVNLAKFSTTKVQAANVSTIGFIGLGNMGLSMCKNLVKSKIADKVFAFDLVPESVQAVVAEGGHAAKTVGELANCDIVITMVPATQHVTSILLGSNQDGLFYKAKKGTTFIDSSTIDPLVSKSLHAKAKELGLHMIDAPVSGGVTGAAAGTLTFMTGAEVKDLEAMKPILATMGKNIVHCGEGGSGGVTKLCNNLALAISMIGTSEAMALGVKLGMDPHKLAHVMNTSTGRCWSSEVYNPVPGVVPGVPSSREYAGGFGSALMEKDLTLAMAAASAVKARLPLGASAHQVYGLLCEHGYANKDFSVVYEYLTKGKK